MSERVSVVERERDREALLVRVGECLLERERGIIGIVRAVTNYNKKGHKD